MKSLCVCVHFFLCLRASFPCSLVSLILCCGSTIHHGYLVYHTWNMHTVHPLFTQRDFVTMAFPFFFVGCKARWGERFFFSITPTLSFCPSFSYNTNSPMLTLYINPTSTPTSSLTQRTHTPLSLSCNKSIDGSWNTRWETGPRLLLCRPVTDHSRHTLWPLRASLRDIMALSVGWMGDKGTGRETLALRAQTHVSTCVRRYSLVAGPLNSNTCGCQIKAVGQVGAVAHGGEESGGFRRKETWG